MRREFPRKVKTAAIASAAGKCEVDGCDKTSARRGLCHAHYWRLRKHGHVGSATINEQGRIMHFIHDIALKHVGDACLFWPFARGGSGSGHLKLDGKDETAHRLVCRLVHGPAPTPKHETAHSCGNGHLACISPFHLRWATHKENEADKLIHGTRVRGSRHIGSKLTEDEVRTIRRRRADGETLVAIAADFGISISLVSMIHSRKVWEWLDA